MQTKASRAANILLQAYERELAAARAATLAGSADIAFRHLERAHILSQRFTLRHVYVHWLMLRLGFATGSCREVTGQAVRMIAAALFSRIWVPAGNTGRAHVSAMQPMPIPGDLRELLQPAAGGASWR